MQHKVCLFGVGLIGGSLALAARESGVFASVVGCGRNESSLRRAVELGVIDSWSLDPADACRDCDLVVLATPLSAFEPLLAKIKPVLSPHAIITDVGSCKGSVVEAATRVFGTLPPNFIPAHPIAGREKSGVEFADGTLFRDHQVIVTPSDDCDSSALAAVIGMWQSVGADVKTLSVEQHDRVLAATSHLPHVLAYALVNTVAQTDDVEQIFEFAAGGFRDSSRVASSDPTMWRDICLDNAGALLDSIVRYREHLAEIEALIKSRDADGLFEYLRLSKEVRDEHFP